MVNQIANLSVQKSPNEQVASASSSHIPVEVWEEAHYMNNGVGNFLGYQTHTPTNYYLEIRNHNNFLYAHPNSAVQPPPGFNEQAKPRKSSFEERLNRHDVEIS